MTHTGTKTIETKRLILRRVVSSDAEAMYRNWASDARVTKFLLWKEHKSVDETSCIIFEWVKSYEDLSCYHWVIVLREIDEPIGSISTVKINEKHLSCEVGYCIGYDWWNRGIVTEALIAVQKYLAGEAGFHRISAKHDRDNPASGRVMEKAGMKLEGIERESMINKNGKFCDMCVWAILADELK